METTILPEEILNIGENEDKIFDKFNARNILPQFIRISNDVIINIMHITSIKREYYENERYLDYNEIFSSLLTDVIHQYMKEHPELLNNDKTPEQISGELYNRFYNVVWKNMEKDYGVCPNQFLEEYKLYTTDFPSGYYISKEIFLQIGDLFGINMRNDFNIEYDD